MPSKSFSSIRAAAPLAVAIAGLAAIPGHAFGAPPSGNLIQNPGAEVTLPETAGGLLPPADWTITGEETAVAYEAPGGFPPATVATAIGGEKNFFGGGDDEVSSASQVIDVSSAATEIDAGLVAATLSGDLGGYSSQNDSATVVATYLSATGAALGSLTIGPVTKAERKEETTLLARSAKGTVPAGTRSISIVLTSTRVEGSYDDGYADNLSLTLGSAAATSAPPVTGGTVLAGTKGIVVVPSAGKCLSKRSFTIHIRQLTGLTPYKSVSVYVRGHRVSVTRGARLSAPVDLVGLPKGRYTVKIEVITNAGAHLSGTRSYHTCAAHALHPKGNPKL